MNDDKDPIYTFFPDDEVPNLYAALGVENQASVDEIKKAYRKLALQYHPDKVAASEDNTKRFHQIGYAYTVLSDEKRRAKYDKTGRTDESLFDGEADWNAYFKELWSGEVNGQTLNDFVNKYKGSDEERKDILAVYVEHEGSLDALFENVMCSNVLEDEDRFVDIVDAAIKAKDIKAYPRWKKDVKDTKGRQKRKEAAQSEATEAEELAKELGVHDKIFGSGKSSKANKGKKSGKVNEDGVDEDALKALMQSRNAKNNRMGSLIESLEARYGSAGQAAKTTKGSKGKAGTKRDAADAIAPSEEEFATLQAKLFSKANGAADHDKPVPKKKVKRSST